MSWAMRVLTWDGPKLMAISYREELRVPETVNCFFHKHVLQIQFGCINWYASKSEHMVKKATSQDLPHLFFVHLEKNAPISIHFPSNPGRRQGASSLINALPVSTSSLLRKMTWLDGMPPCRECVLDLGGQPNPAKMMGLGVAPKYSWCLCIRIYI